MIRAHEKTIPIMSSISKILLPVISKTPGNLVLESGFCLMEGFS